MHDLEYQRMMASEPIAESPIARPSTSSPTPVVPRLSLAEYDAWTIRERTDTARMSRNEAQAYNIVCLSSENGEVSDAYKRMLRGDYKTYGDYREDILLELGDTLHYICRIAADHGFALQDVADANVEKLVNRKLYGKGGNGKRS